MSAVEVECYSGTRYAEQPRAFTWIARRYQVSEIEWAWRGLEGPHFVVRTTGGDRFHLYYEEGADRWHIDFDLR